MITKTFPESGFKSKLSLEERRRADALVYLILTVVVLILAILSAL